MSYTSRKLSICFLGKSGRHQQDGECYECVWLPLCVGGCPHHRLIGDRNCVAFKDDPEAYVMALHARIGEDKDKDKDKGEGASAS